MDEINPYILFNELTPTEPSKDITNIVSNIKRNNGVPVEGEEGVAPPPIVPGLDFNSAFSEQESNRISLTEYNIRPEEVYARVGDEEIARYPAYFQGIDNNEYYAQTQSTAQKWSRGINKFFQKTGTSVLGGTIGSVVGLYEGIKEGSFSAIYDNDFNQMLDDYNEKLDYRLANYYTQEEQQKNFWESLGTANFWANDVLGGLSFTAGMIVSEGIWAYATGGTSLVARGIMGGAGRWSSRMLGKTKSLQALNKLKEPTKRVINNTALKDFKNVQQAAIRGARIPKALNQARFVYTSAGYEAGVEARHYIKEMEDEWLMNFQEENKRMPTTQEYAEFYNETQNSANAVFGVNMGLVGGSNAIIFGKMLLGKSSKAAVNNSALNRELFGLGYTMENGVATAIKANTRQQIARRVFPLAKASLVEGIYEEGGQAVTSQAVKDYVLSSYDNRHTEETADYLESILGGLRETFTTREGQKEVGIGMIIGLLGGGIRPAISGMRGEQRQIENIVERRNQFTPERVLATQITVERFRANNKILKANESSQRAREKGDITGEFLSDRQAIIASIERDTMLQGREQGKKDFEAYLNTVDNAELASQLGMTEQEAQEWKATKIQEYNNLSDNYNRNEKYARAMLGSNVAGAQNLSEKASTEELIRALAFNMTLSEQANEFAEKIIGDIKILVGNNFNTDEVLTALEVDKALAGIDKEVLTEFDSIDKQIKELENRLRIVESELVSEQYNPNQSDPQKHSEKLQSIQGELIKLQEERDVLAGQRETAFAALQLNNELITVEDLSLQEQRINDLQEVVEKHRKSNPQLADQLNILINEYAKTKTNIVNFNEITKTLTDPNLRLKTIEGWLGSIINKNANIEEATAEVFRNQLTQYQQNQTQGQEFSYTAQQEYNQRTQQQPAQQTVGDEMLAPQPEMTAPVTDAVYQDFVDNNNVPTEVLRGLALKIMAGQQDSFTKQEQAIVEGKMAEINDIIRELHEGNPIEYLKGLITEIMQEGPYTTSYIGEDYNEAVKRKPDQEELDRYEELLSKIPTEFLSNFTELMNAPINYFETNNIDIGLSKAELEELRNLQNKLNQWKVLRGSYNNNRASVADLINLIEQLERQEQQPNTQEFVDEFQMGELKNEADNQTQRFETAEGVQSPDQVVTRVVDERGKPHYLISHLNVDSLLRLFPDSSLSLVEKDKTTPITELTENKLNRSRKRQGTKFILTTPEGQVTITVGERSRLLIPKSELDAISNSKLRFITIPRRTFIDVYEVLDNGETIPLRGDFTYADLSGQIDLNPESVNSVQDGDVLILRLNTEDSHNQTLIESYNRSKKEEKDLNELMNNLHIYVTKQNGELVGSLRANNNLTKNEATTNLIEIRRRAVNQALEENPDPYFSIGVAVPVKTSLIGTPNLVINSDGTVQHIDFTNTAIEKVRDVGYMEGTTIKTKTGNIGQIVKTFLPKETNQKVPFVVVEESGKLVAYPVSLKATTENLTEMVDMALSSTSNEIHNLSVLNDVLINYGLQPSKYIINNNGNLEVNRQRLNEDIQEVKVLPNIEGWLQDSYDFNRLQNEATISVDLDNRPFNMNKIMLDLSGRRDIGSQEQAQAEFNDYENTEIRLRTEIQDAVNVIMGPKMNLYPDVDNVRWTNKLFAEGALERNPENDLQRRMNINMMRDALYYEDGRKARVPKAVVEAYGQEFIDNLRNSIERLDKIVEYKKKVKTNLKNKNIKKQAEEQNTECQYGNTV